MDVFKLLLGFIIHSPSHYVHNRCIPKRFTSLDIQLKLSLMIVLVTSLAQSNQVVRCITASLSTFKMMDIKDWVFTLTVTMLTLMTIPCKNILTNVPETHLFASLIIDTPNVRILYQLSIELSYLNRGLRYRQYFMHITNDLQMSIDTVLDAWSKPPFFPFAVVKSCLAVSQSVAPFLSLLSSRREQRDNILSQYHFGRKEFFRVSGRRNAYMLCSSINAQTDLLHIGRCLVVQLDCKRCPLYNTSLSVTQESSYISMPFGRHQWIVVCV